VDRFNSVLEYTYIILPKLTSPRSTPEVVCPEASISDTFAGIFGTFPVMGVTIWRPTEKCYHHCLQIWLRIFVISVYKVFDYHHYGQRPQQMPKTPLDKVAQDG
jgi:hypothetical protein